MTHKLAHKTGPLPEAGCTVIYVLNSNELAIRDISYRVKYDCCGRRQITTHNTLRAKIKKGIKLCTACCRKKNNKPRQVAIKTKPVRPIQQEEIGPFSMKMADPPPSCIGQPIRIDGVLTCTEFRMYASM